MRIQEKSGEKTFSVEILFYSLLSLLPRDFVILLVSRRDWELFFSSRVLLSTDPLSLFVLILILCLFCSSSESRDHHERKRRTTFFNQHLEVSTLHKWWYKCIKTPREPNEVDWWLTRKNVLFLSSSWFNPVFLSVSQVTEGQYRWSLQRKSSFGCCMWSWRGSVYFFLIFFLYSIKFVPLYIWMLYSHLVWDN